MARLRSQIETQARRQAAHPPAGPAVAVAQAAAVAPGPAARGAAARAAVQELAEAPSSGFEAAEFKNALRRKLNEVMPAPNSAEDAQKSLQSGTAHAAGSAMRGELDTRKDRATGGHGGRRRCRPRPGALPAGPAAWPSATAPPHLRPRRLTRRAPSRRLFRRLRSTRVPIAPRRIGR
ncbi:hypothetical protein [Siccirubricoccus sp. G192]|uniref:hypothetical protein n=1 Tax=Siccirubricoccus sp. G192 TaxID=2849651 RepID=UPI001C2C9E1F|nr:hypothetical protein [Siccirubricoccus sp. G192]MBV1800632.1 hypothetical protein [Siccirubricoccus sp. G192]MBV1800697.1 hypothetical protein [Siccirubricoccus sp. G192]